MATISAGWEGRASRLRGCIGEDVSRNLRSDEACYHLASSKIKSDAVGKTNIPKVRQLNESNTTMGDRSPKSVPKQASQKQAKTNDSNQKKKALITAQQATKAKAAANKK